VKLFTRIPLGDITSITKGHIPVPLSVPHLTLPLGLYILSPLEEASRSPDDNYGFLISYLPARLTTRISSYSVRNTVRPIQPSRRLQRLTSNNSKGSAALSRILTNVALATGAASGDTAVTAAFKALPVDNIGRAGATVDDPVMSAATCRDAVDVMVNMLSKACEDAGSVGPEFIVEKDIVT
jgi:hypothetical protein